MKTGKELILATKPFAVDEGRRSWWCVLSTAGLLLAALAAALGHLPLIARLTCSVLAGLLILRFFVIYHDQQHHAILPHSRLADALMTGFGIYCLSPSTIWKASHNHHSKLRGSHIGSFPVMTKAQFLRSPRAERRKYLFMRHPLTILFGYLFVFLYGMCLYPFLNRPREHYDGLIALVVHVVIGVTLTWCFGWPGLLLTQTLPHLVACGLGSYLFYAQHNFPDVSFHDAAGWTYEKAALESSSYLKTGPLMAWFTGHIGCHHIHHLNARIPFYRLPEVLRAIPELQAPKTTSLDPMEVRRCLRLKVWDVEAQRMVGMPQAGKTVARGFAKVG